MAKIKRNPLGTAQARIDEARYLRDAAGYYGLKPEYDEAKERLREAQAGKKKARKAIKAKRKQKHR